MIIPEDFSKLSNDYVMSLCEELETGLDEAHICSVEQLQKDVFNFVPGTPTPILVSTRNDVAHETIGDAGWPRFSFGRMWHDPAAMLINELLPVYESMLLRDDKVFTLRPNMSQVFMPSFFGVDGTFIPGNEDSMPVVHQFLSKQQIISMLGAPLLLSRGGMMEKYLSILDAWSRILMDFPTVRNCVHFCLPDLLGPCTLLYTLRGIDLYTDVYDDPQFVHEAMEMVTNGIIQVLKYIAPYIGLEDHGFYWNYCFPGRIRNVDDNSILFSKEQYEEFVRPYNDKLYDACGGGILHYCGKAQHILDSVMNTKKIVGINFGNPELQDWDTVYSMAQRNRKVLLWDMSMEPKRYSQLIGGVIMKVFVKDLESGKKILDDYRRSVNV